MPRLRVRLMTTASAVTVLLAASALLASAGVDGPLSSVLYVNLARGEDALVSEISNAASLPLGCEISIEPRREHVGSSTLPSRTLLQALNDWMRLDPRYERRDVGGVAVIRSRRAWQDSSDVLNRRVGPIEWRNINRLEFLLRVTGLVGHQPDDDTASTYQGARFSVIMPSGRVLDVLNAGVRNAGAFSWVVETSAESVRATAISYAADRDGEPGQMTIKVRR